MHSILQNLKAEESMSLASQIVSAAGDDEEKQSLVSMLNSSRFSVVQLARDAYAEDIVIQKVIYYISLFKDDVRDALMAKRSKDQLAQVLMDVENE